jgi:DNA primase
MDGVERVFYRLPELLGSPASVWIVEGEKDVETLRAINQTATCNPGGAGKWLPAYSQYLRDQYVYLVPDNDEPGQKHSRAVLASLAGLVEWVKWLQLPREFNGRPVKDLTDLREACGSDDALSEQLEKLQKTARLIERGVESRLATRLEIQDRYRAGVCQIEEESLPLDNWLPGLWRGSTAARGLARRAEDERGPQYCRQESIGADTAFRGRAC